MVVDDVNYSFFFFLQLGQACEKVGFFIVTGHGIPTEVIQQAWEVVHRYFDMPVEEKVRMLHLYFPLFD